MSVDDVLVRASRRNVRYVLVVGVQHERHGTVDCTLLVNGRSEGEVQIRTYHLIR